MRKISKQASYEFWNNGTFNKSNTKVINGKMFLFGNNIATKTGTVTLTFSMCGYPTVTTRERLNALGVPVHQSNGEQKVNGTIIDCFKEYNYNTVTNELREI